MLLRCGACSCPCVALCRERAPTGWRSTPCASPRTHLWWSAVCLTRSRSSARPIPSTCPVTGVERHLPRAHSGSRRLARHPAAEEVATTGEDESNTLSSSSTVRASPYGRLSNHPALLEPLSEPLLAPIMPLLAVGGYVWPTPPVPRVTDLIVSCTPQTAERWRRCRRTWAVAASSSRARIGVAVAARSPSARHAYVCREATARAGRRRLADGHGAAGCGRACVGRMRHSLADGTVRLWSRKWAHSVVCRTYYMY